MEDTGNALCTILVMLGKQSPLHASACARKPVPKQLPKAFRLRLHTIQEEEAMAGNHN